MPEIETKYFGRMPYEYDACLEFPAGLPAFEEEHNFLPIEITGVQPLVFLQSMATASLCFIALPVLVADPQYELAVAPEDLERLGLESHRQPHIGREVLVLVLLSIQTHVTANLLAPVVVNLANRRAVQAVRDDFRYSHQHALSFEQQEQAC